MMRSTLICLALLMASFAAPAAEPEAYIPIEQRFNAEQRRAAGLDKLTSEELASLNQLLREETATLVRAAIESEKRDTQGLPDASREKREAIESVLKGEFRGWDGLRSFELENGQTWRMTEPDELYMSKTLINPKVKITPGLIGGWYLQVEGAPVRTKVRRVK